MFHLESCYFCVVYFFVLFVVCLLLFFCVFLVLLVYLDLFSIFSMSLDIGRITIQISLDLDHFPKHSHYSLMKRVLACGVTFAVFSAPAKWSLTASVQVCVLQYVCYGI